MPNKIISILSEFYLSHVLFNEGIGYPALSETEI